MKEITHLSIIGALIPCDQEFELFSKCLFQIPLSGDTDDRSVQAEGEFVWSNTESVAIKLTPISPDSLNLLQKIILYNAKEPDKIES